MNSFIAVLAALLTVIIGGCAGVSRQDARYNAPTRFDVARPTISATSALSFLGKEYVLKAKDENAPVRLYEYFTANETPKAWSERLAFQVHPMVKGANSPMQHATRTGRTLRQRNPQAQFELYENQRDDTAGIDFLTWPGSGDGPPEFNAFKFFRDSGSNRVVSVRYSKKIRIEGRTQADTVAELKRLRADVVPAIMQFPLYRQ